MRKNITLFVTLIVLPLFCQAQSFQMLRRNRDMMINVGVGTAHYFGEMSNSGDLGKIRPSILAGAEYYFTERFSTRAALTWFQIEASDEDADDSRRQRNLSFKSQNIELSAVGILNLVQQGFRFNDRPGFNLHAFAGVGLMYFNPKAEYDGKWYALQPLQTEGKKYSRLAPVIPFGFGARIKINPFTNILLEGGYRLTFTDYLDDVSSLRYADPATLKSDLARALADRRAEYQEPNPDVPGRRGSPSNNDGYFLMNISLQYYLPYEFNQNPQKKLYNRRAYLRKVRRRR